MEQLVDKVRNVYQYYIYDLSDSRTSKWFLVNPPWIPVFIIGIYMYFVLKWGPNFMKHRPPFNLGSIIKTYNLLQIAACVYLVITLLKYGWKRYTFQCEPLSFSENLETMQHVKGVYFYYLLKIIDLLDTVFIVLRKKENQATFLHVYHHAVMIMIGWLWTRYFSDGYCTLTGSINSFVHIWMYGYYFVTSLWPHKKRYIWWKRYITQLQIIQFVVIFGHAFIPFFKGECLRTRFPCFIVISQSGTFFCLFLNFYFKSYKNNKKFT